MFGGTDFLGILETGAGITTPLGLVGFAVAAVAVVYLAWLGHKRRQFKALRTDRARIGFVSGWLGLDVEKLGPEETLELARDRMAERERLSRRLIALGAFTILLAMIFLTLDRFRTEIGRDIVSCLQREAKASEYLSRERYKHALAQYEHLVTVCDDPTGSIHDGIATAWRGLGKPALALEWRRRAVGIVLADPRAAPLERGLAQMRLAYSLEAVKDFDGALAAFRAALDLLPPGSGEYDGVVYSIAAMEMELWLATDYPALSGRHDRALTGFRRFIEIGGFPDHWARYHMACLLAATPDAGAEAEAADLLAEAAEAIRLLPDEDKGGYHKLWFLELLLDPESFVWQPTLPLKCPAFERFLATCGCRDALAATIARF